MHPKKRYKFRKKSRDPKVNPEKQARYADALRKETVNTRAFTTKQKFGPASKVRIIDPSEYKIEDDS